MEEQVIPAASIEDIDARAFRSFLRAQGLDTGEEPQPPIADDLRNRRILAEFDGTRRPTLYGLMANAVLVARLMEQRGRGWPVMRQAMREFNGTEPELVQDEGGKFVRVTFRTGFRA